MKIVTIIGARPQFIKAGVISRAIATHNKQGLTEKVLEILLHTGQHYDANMSDVFFREMRIPKPDYYIGINKGTHGNMTGCMLGKIEEILIKEKPEAVLVYGDTNSTLAGALAAVKLHIPVAHVEAGLRSFNMKMPEEVNRVLTDRISYWLFCPTETAVINLKNEGLFDIKRSDAFFGKSLVFNVGDVMYDAAIFYKKIAEPTDFIVSLIDQLKDGFYLSTVHRAENTDDSVNLENIINALEIISEKKPVILPLHPRTRKLLNINNILTKKIRIINPIGYFDMITLLENCEAVFTDSGGLQKEAYFFHKPCITLRNETEWVELVEGGFNILVEANCDKIVYEEKYLNNRKLDYSKALYGRGDTGNKIVKALLKQKNYL